jgi:hypothetical protein
MMLRQTAMKPPGKEDWLLGDYKNNVAEPVRVLRIN